MGNCFSSTRGTTGKLNDPTHGTGLTSLHSMQGGPLGVGVDQPGTVNSVLDHLQGRGGPITSDVGVRSNVLDPGMPSAMGIHQIGIDHRPLPEPVGDVLGHLGEIFLFQYSLIHINLSIFFDLCRASEAADLFY